MAAQASVTLVASLKADDLKRGAAAAKADVESLGKATASSGEAMALGMAKGTVAAEKFGRASKASSDLARAGAIAAAQAEADLAAAIKRVVDGTASASDRSRALAAARREATAATRAQAEAEKLAARAHAGTGGAMDQVGAAMGRALGPAGNLMTAFQGGGAMAAGAMLAAGAVGVAAMAVQQLGRVMGEAVTAAGRAEAQMAAFGSTLRGLGLDVTQAEAIIEKFKGALADDEAIAGAVRNLSIMGLGFSTQEKVIGRIQDLAVQSGQDVDKALESISQAVISQQTRALKGMGILVDQTEAQKRYREALGITKRDLTEVEKQLAFVDEFMRKSAFADGSAKNGVLGYDQAVQNMNRAYGNMLETLGSSEGTLGSLARWWVDAQTAVANYINEVNRVPGGGRLANQVRLMTGGEDTTGAARSAPVYGTAVMSPQTAARVARGEIPPPAVSVSPEDEARGRAEAAERIAEARRANAEEADRQRAARREQARTAAENAARARQTRERADAQRIANEQAGLAKALQTSLELVGLQGYERERAQALNAHKDRLARTHGDNALIAMSRKQYWFDLHAIDEKENQKRAADAKSAAERDAKEAKSAGEKAASAYREGLKIESLHQGRRLTPEAEMAGVEKRIVEIGAQMGSVAPQDQAELEALTERAEELFLAREEARIAAAERTADALAQIDERGMDAEIARARHERDETLLIAEDGSRLALDAEALFQARRNKIVEEERAKIGAAFLGLAGEIGKKFASGGNIGASDAVGLAGGAANLGITALQTAGAISGPQGALASAAIGAGVGIIVELLAAQERRASEMKTLVEGIGKDREDRERRQERTRDVRDIDRKIAAAADPGERLRMEGAKAAALAEHEARARLAAEEKHHADRMKLASTDAAVQAQAQSEHRARILEIEEEKKAAVLDAAEAQLRAAKAQEEAISRQATDMIEKLNSEKKRLELRGQLVRGEITEEQYKAGEQGISDVEQFNARLGEIAATFTTNAEDQARVKQALKFAATDKSGNFSLKTSDFRSGLDKENVVELLRSAGIGDSGTTGGWQFRLVAGDAIENLEAGRGLRTQEERKAAAENIAAEKTAAEKTADSKLSPGETPQMPLYVHITNPKDLWAAEPASSRFRATRSATTRSVGIHAPGPARLAG